MKEREKVLFVCIHNSARSQMAEELLRCLAGDRFEVESAGIEPGRLNPYVVQVLKEDEGIDIAGKPTQSVHALYRAGKTYDYVITVCDAAQSERCPVFPGGGERLHWGFTDPSQFQGDDAQSLAFTRAVKEQIKKTIVNWLGGRQG